MTTRQKRSSRAIREHFEVLEEHGYGGSVLHIALSGIAHNFTGDDPDTLALLAICFDAEDAALPELGHDFMAMVCRPATHTSGASSSDARDD